MARARPTKYTEKLAKEICDTIAESSKGLKTLCKENPHWPYKRTIATWRETKPGFGAKYTRAKLEQTQMLADEIIEISDADNMDVSINEETGEWVSDGQVVQRSKLRIETRKWIASKLMPKVYGDKVTHSGDADNPITITHEISGNELARKIAFMLQGDRQEASLIDITPTKEG